MRMEVMLSGTYMASMTVGNGLNQRKYYHVSLHTRMASTEIYPVIEDI